MELYHNTEKSLKLRLSIKPGTRNIQEEFRTIPKRENIKIFFNEKTVIKCNNKNNNNNNNNNDSNKMGSWEPKHNQLLCMVNSWATCRTYTIAGIHEMYEQLLPTLYPKDKTQTSTDGEVLCRLCGKVAESVAHVLAGCSSWHKSSTYTGIMQLWRFCFLSSLEGMGW